MPSEDEEATLWAAFRGTGSTAAREALFAAYTPFARRLARRHALGRGSGDIEFGDLLQLAYAGLLESIDRFDPERGVPFAGYASRRVTGSIRDGVAKMSELREQLSFRHRVRYERARSMVSADVDALSPTEVLDELIDAALGLALGFMLEGTSLYVAEEEPDHAPNAYDSLVWRETQQRARTEISMLPPREQFIIARHYLDGMAFEQIAEALGLSKGRISQLHRAALMLLKKRLLNSQDFRLRR
ncbi:sigma-70 family RNA polymerase sigma factor [Caulobacter radicis]|uniref:sigma-70 family RNA polymerase sigma factor n=1 Tax=Caulobacter radicis TaxID=2172650 RepID=UPI001AD83D88|nr:sigma-70 family RNA polymerase sigma factor [Caulobacter radicis]